jgi:hypothetical protein
MDVISAILATLTLIIITQVFRQLLPNCFAYPWQLGLHEVIPKQFEQHRWFKDKDSLFYFSDDEKIVHTFPILSQSNLRSVVLLGGMSLWIFLNFNVHEIQEGFDAVLTLSLIAAFVVLPIKVVFDGLEKFNPDIVIFISFHVASFLIALQFVTVNF